MNTISSARKLEFTECADFGGVWYRAATPFGSYGYAREDEGRIKVFSDFEGDERQKVFVIVGNAVAAQLACNRDFTRRIIESLEMAA